MTSSLNIFTVQFIQSIEREINEFILKNDINVSFEILPIIYKIIASVKSNPKFAQVLENTTVAQEKILSILKKYVVDFKEEDKKEKEEPEPEPAADTVTDKVDTSVDTKADAKLIPKLMPKTLILDSQKRTPSQGDIYFKFKDPISVSNLNIDCLTFTTRATINEPYILVFIKQFKTTHFSDVEGGIGCYATLLLDNVVHAHNDIITYRYRNHDMNNINPNTITLDALNFILSFPSTGVYKINSHTNTTIGVDNVGDIRVDDRMRLLSEDDSLPPREIIVTGVNKESNVITYGAGAADTDAADTGVGNADAGDTGVGNADTDAAAYTMMENINSRVVIMMKYL